MTTRISFQNTYSNLSRMLAHFNEDLGRITEELSSGKRVITPSDDPVATVSILGARKQLSLYNQYERNMTMAESWLNIADSAVTQASVAVDRARELAEQMATGTYSEANRLSAAQEIQGLIDTILNLGNTKVGDDHIFAGSLVDTSPFTESFFVSDVITGANNSKDYCGIVTSGGNYYDNHAELDNGYRWRMQAVPEESSSTAALNYSGYFSFYYDNDGDYDGTNQESADIAGFYNITSGMSLESIASEINQGTAARGQLTLTGWISAGDTININGVTYTFASAAGGSTVIALGASFVDGESAINALVNTVNAGTAGGVWAVDDGDGTAWLYTKTVGTTGNNTVFVSTSDITGQVTVNGSATALASGTYLGGGGSAWVAAEVVSGSYGYQLLLTGEDVNTTSANQKYFQIYMDSTSGPVGRLSGGGATFFSPDYNDVNEWTTFKAVNQPLFIWAKEDGTDGDDISIQYKDPGKADSPLSILVNNNQIVVSLETDAGGNVVSTAAEVRDAINNHPEASQLVVADAPDYYDSTAVVNAMAMTSLTGGDTAQSRRYRIVITTSGAVGGPAAAYTDTSLSGANNDIQFEAVSAGTAGNNISIRYLTSAGYTSTSVDTTVSGNTIDVTVYLGASADGTVSATAADVLSAVLNDASAAMYISGGYVVGNDGSGVVTAMNWAIMDGGAEQARFMVEEYYGGEWTQGNLDHYAVDTTETQIFDELNSEYLGVTVKFTDRGVLDVGDTYYIDANYYQGNEDHLKANVSTSGTITRNITGTEMLGGAGDKNNALDNLRKLRDAMVNNDQDGVQESLDQLSDTREAVIDATTSIGATLNRIEMRRNVNTEFALTAAETLTEVEGVDVTQAIAEMNMLEIIYQAALTATTRITSLSLVDYM